MAGITCFEEIEAWKTARQLTNMIYELGNQTGFKRRISDDEADYEVAPSADL